MRGTEAPGAGLGEALRITPACAGNRSASAVKEAEEKDHPRVCGEQARVTVKDVDTAGSPPRVRGTGNS